MPISLPDNLAVSNLRFNRNIPSNARSAGRMEGLAATGPLLVFLVNHYLLQLLRPPLRRKLGLLLLYASPTARLEDASLQVHDRVFSRPW
jgi:hypothetical protein